MANNYLQFSEEIEDITDEEAAWISTHLNAITYEADQDTPKWKDLADYYGFEDSGAECIAFEWSLEGNSGGQSLWIRAEEYGDLDHVSKFVQAFIHKWRPNYAFMLSWASTCSKLRIGEFDGGAIFVTANQSHHICGSNWAAEKLNKWNKQHAS